MRISDWSSDVCSSDLKFGINRAGNRATMAQNDDVVANFFGRLGPLLNQIGALLQRKRRTGPNRSAHRQPHVRHDDIGASLAHGDSLIGIEDIRRSKQILGSSGPGHINLQRLAHTPLFTVLSDYAVDPPHRWTVVRAARREKEGL